MIHKIEMELDFHIELNEDGLDYLCFINDEDEPIVETTVDWDTLVNRFFDYHAIPGYTEYDLLAVDKTSSINPIKEIHQIIVSLEQAAEALGKRLEASKILDRGAWVESRDLSREDFIVDFSYDYLE